MHTPSLADYVACLDASDLDGVAALMLDSADRLARAGADFLVCPDNTIHQAMHLVQPRSPLPWLHIAQVVASEASARGFRRLGRMGRLIMDELVRGVFEPATVRYFQSVIETFQAVRCDAVILGCTEIPLIVSDANSALPTLDSTRLLARAAIDRACSAAGQA